MPHLSSVVDTCAQVVSQPTPCEQITDYQTCINSGCYWYDNSCHSSPQPTPPALEKWWPILIAGGMIVLAAAIVSRGKKE